MHGREGGDTRKRIRHMWSVPSSSTVVAVDSNGSSLTHFFKDGRKISVGDSALFKSPQDSPPFIGIIRCLTSGEESKLTLSVNWLYRPAEVKLGKGVAPEATPNEVFYSFHSDEIPAASLLHPCKVAFLPKGVELPLGVSSFVCRRVYDITHKCLWWLTDQDYADDRQKEVDQLLHKTRIEMHATAQHQQGAHSPKPVNGSAATSPLKHSPDSVQNSSSNLSSYTKGKKRERGDQSTEYTKRERSARADEGDSGQLRLENILKLEIAKIAERGGLVDSEMVERLVQLMQPEKPERKIDLTGRSMLAGIIAATDNVDCLSKFVQLKGLPVLDEWLQEVHRGKIRDCGNVKYGDTSVENFLLVLLRALDKLPVNLNALQMCNIGKSVNHLRSHKNNEIQKKARSLVDTWKKRVEAEMNMNDAKSGSGQSVAWPGRSQHGSPHSGNRHTSGSSDAAIRSSITHQSSLKCTSVKLVQADSTSKSASVYPVGARSALSPALATANKDEQARLSANGASSEPPQTVVKEEKSSSSSQSHTNSQCSSDHAKNLMPSVKEDARSSTAGSKSLNKTTGSGSKHRKSANDLQGPTCGIQRETLPNRGASVARIPVAEKPSDNVNAVDASVPDASSHKLIVKIPNRGRTAAQSIVGGAVEDSSCRNSGASSPASLEKHDQSDAYLREKLDARQSSENVDGLSTSAHHRTSNDNRRLPNFSRVVSSPSGNEMKPKKALDSSFSSMNALVESCVKFSEANASVLSGDDVGMNLLASVAAGEISKSATASPSISPNRDPSAAENAYSNYNANKKQLHGEGFPQQSFQPSSIADAEKRNSIVGVTSNHPGTFSEIVHQNEEGCLKSNGKLDEKVGISSPIFAACASGRRVADGGTEVLNGKSVIKEEGQDQLPVADQQFSGSYDKVKDASLDDKSEKRVHREAVSHSSPNLDDEKNNVCQVLQSRITLDTLMVVKSEPTNTNEKTAVLSSCTGQELAAETSNELKPGKSDSINTCDHTGLEHSKRVEEDNPTPMPLKQEEPGLPSIGEQNNSCKDENVGKKETLVHQSGSSAKPLNSSAVDQREPEVNLNTKGSDVTASEEQRKDDVAMTTGNRALLPTVGGLDTEVKLGFDLNEGFSMDDGKSAEPAHLGAGPYPTADRSASSLLLPVSSASSGLPASITVAAAAKGPFVPPDDLLRNKTELGWKGSAATSAFRPAEPRKIVEEPLGPINSSLPNAPSCKQSRPPLDIDLNVADERIFCDVGCQTSGQGSNSRNTPMYDLISTTSLRCSGGFDLDLNEVDGAVDVGQHSTSNGQKLEVSILPGKATSSIIFSNGEAGSRRDFDLNNGPATEEMPVDKTSYNQHGRSNIHSQGPFGPRINSSDAGNCFAWYPPGNSYSVSMTPSALPDRESFPIVGTGSGGPQRVIGGPTSNLSFNPDTYRGSMLSSTPTIPFNSTPFQYPVFPFGTSFPHPTPALSGGASGFMVPSASGRISAIPSHLVGTAAAVPFQYPHAYVVSRPIPDVGNNSVIDSNQKRGKQGLDLNSGPGSVDAEGRDESLPTTSRHLSAISSLPLAGEQTRMYNMAGGVLKRKEPEGGWSVDNLNFKQSSWR